MARSLESDTIWSKACKAVSACVLMRSDSMLGVSVQDNNWQAGVLSVFGCL